MKILPPPLRLHAWRPLCALCSLGVLALLAGCASSDFGEINSTLVTDGIHDWLGRDSLKSHPVPASTFEYTDDERALRDNAYPLIEPPYDRQQWNSVAGEYGVKRTTVTDRHKLYDRLMEECHRSSAALYARLIDDIRNDTTRLSQFFETAGRVIDIDQKREKSLAYVSEASKRDRANALRRVRENAHVVEIVRWSLEDRVLAYQYVLERLVIETPMSQAVDVERLLNQLKSTIARYQALPPTWRREPSLASSN
jgi:hypothetical protein